jgi:predicted transcriptional regulator
MVFWILTILLNWDKMDQIKQTDDRYKECERKIMKRSRDVIITQILGICSKGATKTRIVYQANLNFKTVNPYIELLSKNGMINVREGENRLYETTPKGVELLECFKAIQREFT